MCFRSCWEPTTKGCRLTTSLTSTPQRRTTAVGRTSFRSSMWCLLSITVILALSFIGKLRFPCRNFNQYKKGCADAQPFLCSHFWVCVVLSCFLTVVVQGYAEKFVPFSNKSLSLQQYEYLGRKHRAVSAGPH